MSDPAGWSTVDGLLMNRPRDPGVIWSKSTQAVVGVLVGCVAAAGIQLVANPVAPDQPVDPPKVSVVMVAEMDPSVAATPEPTVSPSQTASPRPSPIKQPPAIAIEQAPSTATPSPAPSRSPTARPTAPPPAAPVPTATPTAVPTPRPTPTPEPTPTESHHHKPPKPPKG